LEQASGLAAASVIVVDSSSFEDVRFVGRPLVTSVEGCDLVLNLPVLAIIENVWQQNVNI